MKKLLVTLLLLSASLIGMAQCTGITMNQTVNVNTATFSASLPVGYTATTYNWTFGDGGSSNQPNPTHSYANSGWYNVCMMVSGSTANNQGFQCYLCDSIYVGGPPMPCGATYTFTQSGLSVSFSGNGTGPGPISNWAWNFGDGNQSSLQNPTHTYAAAGTYVACLTVYGVANGTTFTCNYCDTITVPAAGPCAPSFTTQAGAGNTINFTNASTAPGPINGYTWNFGDGGTSSLQNPSHTYANSGWYNVCLTIWGQGPNGAFQCQSCDSVFVGNVNPGPCNAAFTLAFGAGGTVNFTNTSTGTGTLSSSYWSFGDGGTSNLTNPVHTYANTGWYNVCLTVMFSTPGGATTCQFCDSVYVQAGPAPCNASFSSTLSGLNAAFSNSASAPGPISTFAWTFGDGGTSSLPNPTHTYATGGSYTVCLTISGVYNNTPFSCTSCDSIYVSGGGTGCTMNANFTGTISGLTANFSNTSTCAGCSSMVYAWSFGDGGTSALTNPSHTYAAGGSYNVCLLATGYTGNQQMCSDTFCYTITVGVAGLNQVQTQSLSLYPNPTSSTVEFSIPGTGTAQLRLSDVSGRVIREEKVNTGSAQRLDIGSLAPGLYFLLVQTENGRYRGNFIKQY